MTRTTNARVAGFTFLFYIAVGISSLTMSGRATRGQTIAAKFLTIAEHQIEMRIVALLLVLAAFSALVLGVTLYAITREHDRDLAMLALICRVAEGLTGLLMPGALMLLWLATATGPGAPDKASAEALGAFLLRLERSSPAAMFFAVGSTLFSWLLLRGRLIPAPLGALGVVASAVLAIVLPLQLAGFIGASVNNFFSAVTWLVWLPMLVFEVTLAAWLLIKGVAPARPQVG
jgi:hypothetical protein